MPEPKPEPVELGELVRSTVFAQRVANPAIEFEAEIPDEPVVATCDERLFGQALLNVIKNAGEAVAARMEAEPGVKDQPGRVEAHLGVDGAFAVIEVRDNGVGWPHAHRERLVEPYMTTREKGTGLGLAIVRRVVEDHHGRLELADRPDGERGAVVRLVLPLDAPAGKDAAEPPAMAADA
jgi:two-component system nitrogen regulation sensor histidine kinase NtrY